MPPPAAPPPRTLLNSFGWAWSGLAEGAVRDRNLRIHLALGVLAGAFAARAPLSGAERAVLLLCVAAVIAAESANSALEAVVDLASPGLTEGARVAKDCAAGAVLALAAGSVLALATIAGPRLPALAAAAAGLAWPSGAALVTGAAAGLLPMPGRRALAFDVALLVAGVAGIAVLAAGAADLAGVAAAALCLAVAASGALRRRRR